MIKEQLKEAKKACRFMQNVKPEVKNKSFKKYFWGINSKKWIGYSRKSKRYCRS